MDPGTIVGILVAFASIFVAQIMEGGQPASLLKPAPLILVFGGTLGAAMAGQLMKDSTNIVPRLKTALLAPKQPDSDLVATVVKLAETARREGLLALEDAARNVDDEFLRDGLMLAVDGTDAEEMREILETRVAAQKKEDAAAAKFFMDMGGYAPTIGIIGTVIGLVHVLGSLSQPDKLGEAIAGAFIATLWGVMSANVLWFPMGNKIKRYAEVRARRQELVVEGVLAIQAGASPRIVEQKLRAHNHGAPPAKGADAKAA
jgi:chemotaxis protein MotA